jgi:hypothetical protein
VDSPCLVDHCSFSADNRSQCHIFFVPQRTVACEQVLEDEGVLDSIEIGEFNLGFLPFDNDLISLEMDNVFRQVSHEHVVSILFVVTVLFVVLCGSRHVTSQCGCSCTFQISEFVWRGPEH